MDARNGMCISQCGLGAQVAYDLKAKHAHVVATYGYPNELEHMCLARFITRLTLIVLPGGQRGYDGSVMIFPNEFNHAWKQIVLPRDPLSLPVVLVKQVGAVSNTGSKNKTKSGKRAGETCHIETHVIDKKRFYSWARLVQACNKWY